MDGVVPYTVDGIFRRGGTVFSAYDADNSFLCTLVAQSVGLEQTIVVPVEKEKPVHGSPTEQPRVIIPPGSRAVVLDWNNDCMILLVHVPAADSLHTGTLFSSNLRRRFRKETLETLAHLIVRSDGKQIVLEPRESMMHCQMKLFDGDIKHLPDVIDGIAHFNYFLNRSNETSRLKGNFSLQMHRLKGEHPQREPDPNFGQDGNLVKDGEVRVASQKGANYGFTICNTSGEDLFPYLFYFDPDEYTIKVSHVVFLEPSIACRFSFR
jgi:hypothetical protein